MTIPAKLQRIYERHNGNLRAIAREININHFYVVQYFRHDVEPTNPVLRAAMFLPKTRRRKPGTVKTTPTPEHWNWWRHLTKDERDMILLQEYLVRNHRR